MYRGGTLQQSVTGMTATLTGLACSTSYSLQVDAFDAAGNRSAKATLSASTSSCPPDTTAPSVPTGLTVGTRTTTSIALSWTASTDNIGVTGYGAYQGATLQGSPTSTSYTFTGLACGTSYTLGVDAYDAAGNRSAKATVIASTSACPDTTAPSVPTGLTVGATGTSTIALSWTASTDNVGVTGYGVYNGTATAGNPTATSYTVTGLSCGTSYSLAVDSVDAAGNRSGKATLSASTAACAPPADTLAPTVPGNFTVVGTTTDSISVSWSQSIDNVGVSSYGLYRNNTLAGSAPGTGYTYSSLACGTTYTLAVDAVDAAQNRSAKATISASTAACPAPTDTQAPSTPTNLRSTGSTPASISIAWNGSTDNVGVTGYRVYNGTATAGNPTATSYTVTGLSCGTSYSLAVDSVDAAGNRSGKATLSASTAACAPPADTLAPTVPGNFTVVGTTTDSISVSWSQSIDNVGVAEYGLYRANQFVGTASGTSFTFTGLSCATSYALAVDAADAAANRSGKASITGSTTACAPAGPGEREPVGRHERWLLCQAGVGRVVCRRAGVCVAERRLPGCSGG